MIRSTSCTVTITTPDNISTGRSRQYVFSTSPYSYEVGGEYPGTLLSAQVSLSLDKIPNTFRLTFAFDPVRGQSWGRMIPQHSLVVIRMGSTSGHNALEDSTAFVGNIVMVGLTGPPQDVETYHSANISRSTTIQGRGIEAALDDARVWHAPYLEIHKDTISQELRNSAVSELGDIFSGTIQWARRVITKQMDPREAALACLAYYAGNMDTGLINMGLPGGRKIKSMLLAGDSSIDEMESAYTQFVPGRNLPLNEPKGWPDDWTSISEAIGERLEHPTAAHNPGGQMSILSMMYQAIDANTHYFYVDYDYVDTEPVARLRHKFKPYLRDFDVLNFWGGLGLVPAGSLFDPSEKVETIYIKDKEVGAVSLSHGQSPIFNVFYVQMLDGSLIGDSISKAEYPPEYCGKDDPSYIGRFGVRPMQYRMPFFPTDFSSTKSKGSLMQTIIKMQKILKSWFSPNPILQTGTIHVAGSSRFKPGRRLVWKDRAGGRPAMEFEISGVSHSFDMSTGSFDTTLQVRRGIAIDTSPTGLHPSGTESLEVS